MFTIARRCAAALSVIFTLAWIPPEALAQMPLPGGLVVTVTSPASGSTVLGSVTVSASTSADVAGVQFRLDGASLGAEDTTAPYSITWDTTTASNGSQTFTPVPRRP